MGVVGDKIDNIYKMKEDTEKAVDAEELMALPRFVDAYSHADWTLLWYPKCESYVTQGVTTFVGIQCGGSPAPLGDQVMVPWLLSDHLFDLDPYNFYRTSRTTRLSRRTSRWSCSAGPWTGRR